jgi:hypothetical protein
MDSNHRCTVLETGRLPLSYQLAEIFAQAMLRLVLIRGSAEWHPFLGGPYSFSGERRNLVCRDGVEPSSLA